MWIFFKILVPIIFSFSLVSCSMVPSKVDITAPTSTAAVTVIPSPTEEFVNIKLWMAYKAAFETGPQTILVETKLGVLIVPSYLKAHSTSDPLPIPNYTGPSLPPQAVAKMIQSIDEYIQAVTNATGTEPSKFLVSWNEQVGEQFAFTIYGVQEVKGQKVIFWSADVIKIGNPDRPLLSLNPIPAEFGGKSPNEIELIQIPLPPDSDSATLRVRWWPINKDNLLQRIPVIVITASKQDYIFNVLKGQMEGINYGWELGGRYVKEGFPRLDVKNGAWQIAAYQTGRDAHGQKSTIIILNGDGSKVMFDTPIAYSNTYFSPKWSPDGTQIAFISGFIKQNMQTFKFYLYNEIFLINADGTGITQLTNEQNKQGDLIDYFDWSPDGKHIAYVTGHYPNHRLKLMNSDGTGLIQLKIIPNNFVWTPDSTGIMYAVKYQQWEITSIDGSATTKLSFDICGGHFRFSPDGKKITYSCMSGPWPEYPVNIWVANADGSNPIRLTNTPRTNDISPTWSPDGRFIAFNRNYVDGHTELWVMKADGSDQALLDAILLDPEWRP